MRASALFLAMAGPLCSGVVLSRAHATPPTDAPYSVVGQVAGADGGWDYVRVNPLTNQVLVTRGAVVMALDLATGRVDPGFAKGARMHIALPVNAGREVLLTNGGTDTAVFVDARTGGAIATVPTGKNPDAAGFDPKTGLALVVDHSGGDVTLVDLRTHKAAGVITVGGDLEETVVDARGVGYVNVESKNEIAVLDLAHRKVLKRYPLAGCDGPTGLAYDAADDLLIAACDGATMMVQARTGTLVASLPTGKGADGVVYDPVHKVALVPAGGDGMLSIIRVSRTGGEIIQRLPTRRGARTIGLDERTGRVYLPSAEYLPPVAGARPQMKPGSFRLLVVAPGSPLHSGQ